MIVRDAVPEDLPTLVDLTIETFRPYYEKTYRAMVSPTVFDHQHASWAEDYRRTVPTMLDPACRRWMAVAEDDGVIAGYIAWNVDIDRRTGELDILAVADSARGQGFGRALCGHALKAMESQPVDVVTVGTGGDETFHAQARRLYTSLGFSAVPLVH